MAQKSKLIKDIVRGTFHQGDRTVFDTNSAGKQCVANCAIAALYTLRIPLAHWTPDVLDDILKQGDNLYKRINSNHDFLQVVELGSHIQLHNNSYAFQIDKEYFGTIGQKSSSGNIGVTLEKSTYSALQLNKRQPWTFCILCIGNDKGAAACLLCLSRKKCFLFDPHSRDVHGLPVYNGTSVLLLFQNRQNMISYIRSLYDNTKHSPDRNATDIYNMSALKIGEGKTHPSSQNKLETHTLVQSGSHTRADNRKRCIMNQRKEYHRHLMQRKRKSDESITEGNFKRKKQYKTEKCTDQATQQSDVMHSSRLATFRANKQKNEKYQKRKLKQNNLGKKQLMHYIDIFNKKTKEGPAYVCTVCLQTWFRISVSKVVKTTWKSQQHKQIFLECTQHHKSVDSQEWLCNTCKASLNKGRWPKLSVVNGMGFPVIPEELKLHAMEERIVSPRLLFFQMRSHFIGGCTRVTGNVVNVAVDVAPTVKLLPRSLSDTQTVKVKYKRKFEYKKCEFTENVRPAAVWRAADYLLKNSDLYKNENIQLNTTWLNTFNSTAVKEIEIFDEPLEQKADQDMIDVNTHITAECQCISPDSCLSKVQEVPNQVDLKAVQAKQTDYDNTENIMTEQRNQNTADMSALVEAHIDVDEDAEVENDFNVIHRDTLLHDAEVPQIDPDSFPSDLTYAPGEDCKPLSIFQDKDVEYLAFPTIFGGKRRKANKYKVSYSDICKYELRCHDKRVAKNTPNIFFKFKKVQMKSVMSKRSLLMRRCKTKGMKIAVRHVLDDKERAKMVRLDEAYYIFRDIRNSPAYLAKKRREAFAMIRQLGFPSLFISQSAAETKWPELLRALGESVDGRTYTDEDIEQMDFATKSRLIRGDSATLVRYFAYRFKVFLNDVVLSDCHPIGHVTDYFWRKEFATRGAIHVHWFAYLKDAPVYGENTNTEIAAYYDKIISCSADVADDHKKYIQYQIHRHSKSCHVGRNRSCRFNFPRPPMPQTCVLEPFSYEDNESFEKGKNLWPAIKNQLNTYGLGNETTHTFQDMLKELNISYHDYILAVRSTLVRAQFFPKRKPCEVRINNYMRQCLHVWRANHDIQPSLSPYAMVEYILSYVTKGQKGMSAHMERACADARRGNMDLKESVRHMGNAFLNSVETGQEEAAFLLLQLPMTFMSRGNIFINTSPKSERTFLVKSKAELEQLDPDSTEIQVAGLISKYTQRPHSMSNYCLADFASKVNICKSGISDAKSNKLVICTDINGTVYKMRRKNRIICYVNYSKAKDSENHYRERLMLFFPWRDEVVDLIGTCGTYEDKYKLHRDEIESIRSNYEKFEEHLDEALVAALNVNSSDDASDNEHDIEITKFGFFDPDRDEKLKQYDIEKEFTVPNKTKKLKKKRYETEVDCSGVHMTDNEYRNTMQILNEKQYELCIHVMHQLEKDQEQMFIFVEGGAGVGKTVLGRGLCETIARYYKKQPGNSDDGKYLLILAPTGMAAYHIKGTTFHTGLHIPVNQVKNITPLSYDERNTLHSQLRNVKFVIIDEVSMVGSRLAEKCNIRLQQIFGSKKPFGGKHVIAIGDFYQMKPVLDSYIFKNSGTAYTSLAPNVWCENFKIFSLDEIMRQKDEKRFCQILNRLRKAECTEEDNKILEQCFIQESSPEYKLNVRHIFPFRHSVDEHNRKIFHLTQGEKVTIEADDVVCGNPIASERATCQMMLENNECYSEIRGLLRTLHAAKNAVYIISCNISTADGLINGAVCTLKHIDYVHSVNSNIPSILWVEFEDGSVGQHQRHEYKQYYTDETPTSWTPIFTEYKETIVCNSKVVRAQFPLVPAAAVTIHKCQGSTLQNVVINMDVNLNKNFAKNLTQAKSFYQHAHYVAASRVSSLEGLQILNWSPHLISVNNEVQEHLHFMSTHRKLELCYTPLYSIEGTYKCSYINTRSLHKHIDDIRFNYILTASDIIMISETRLSSIDRDADYQISGYQQIIRYDEPAGNTLEHILRPYHGLAIYVKNGIKILDVLPLRTSGFESLCVCLHTMGTLKPVQFIAVYVSPKANFQTVTQNMDNIMDTVDLISAKCIILGDFNMKSILPDTHNANSKIAKHMRDKYNLEQYVNESTTENASMLDLCFCSETDINCMVTWNHWSDHKIVSAVLP